MAEPQTPVLTLHQVSALDHYAFTPWDDSPMLLQQAYLRSASEEQAD